MPGPTDYDPFFSNVVAQWMFHENDGDTSFVDSSGNGHTLTVIGNPMVSNQDSKYENSSLWIQGTATHAVNYLTSDTSSDFALDGDFTIEAWAKPNSQTDNYVSIVSSYGSDASTGQIQIGLYTTNGWTCTVHFSGNFHSIYTTDDAVLGEWTHVCVERVGSTIKLFINGVAVPDTLTYSGTIIPGNRIEIGTGNRLGDNGDWDGYIEAVRITKGVARYGGNNFTVCDVHESFGYQNLSIPFAGTATYDFETSGLSSVDFPTLGAVVADWCWEGVRITGAGVPYARKAFGSMSELWLSYTYGYVIDGSSELLGGNGWLILSESVGSQPLFRLIGDSDSGTTGYYLISGQIWNGSTWDTIGSGLFWRGGGSKMDVRLNIDDTYGKFALYSDGYAVFEFEGDTKRTAATHVGAFEFGKIDSSIELFKFDWILSAVIVANRDTRRMTFVQSDEDTYSYVQNYSEWAGTSFGGPGSGFGDSGSTVLTANTVGLLETYQYEPIDTMYFSNHEPGAVFFSARARQGDGSAPANIKFVMQEIAGDVITEVNPDTSLSGSYSNLRVKLNENPATGLPWANVDLSLYQIGLISVT